MGARSAADNVATESGAIAVIEPTKKVVPSRARLIACRLATAPCFALFPAGRAPTLWRAAIFKRPIQTPLATVQGWYALAAIIRRLGGYATGGYRR